MANIRLLHGWIGESPSTLHVVQYTPQPRRLKCSAFLASWLHCRQVEISNNNVEARGWPGGALSWAKDTTRHGATFVFALVPWQRLHKARDVLENIGFTAPEALMQSLGSSVWTGLVNASGAVQQRK